MNITASICPAGWPFHLDDIIENNVGSLDANDADDDVGRLLKKLSLDRRIYDYYGRMGIPSARDLLDIIDPTRSKHHVAWVMGSGWGHWAAELSEVVPDVVGFDISAEMIELATADHPEVRFLQQNAVSASDPTVPHLIWSQRLLEFLDGEQRIEAIAHWLDSLAEGGTLVIEELVDMTMRDPFFALLNEYWMWLADLPEVERLVGASTLRYVHKRYGEHMQWRVSVTTPLAKDIAPAFGRFKRYPTPPGIDQQRIDEALDSLVDSQKPGPLEYTTVQIVVSKP